MAKHKYIKEPELIWEYFQAYRKNVKDNPRMKVEYVGKDGERVNTPIERPLIIEGFFSYCREHYSVEMRHYWFNTEGDARKGGNKSRTDRRRTNRRLQQ